MELTNGAGVALLKTIMAQYNKGKTKPVDEAWVRVKKEISFASIDPSDDRAAVELRGIY